MPLETQATDQMSGGRAGRARPFHPKLRHVLCACRDEERPIGYLTRERYALNHGSHKIWYL